MEQKNTNAQSQSPAASTPAPAPAAPAKPGLSVDRQTVLAQHFMNTPDTGKPGLLAHLRAHGTPDEKAFIEKLASTRN